MSIQREDKYRSSSDFDGVEFDDCEEVGFVHTFSFPSAKEEVHAVLFYEVRASLSVLLTPAGRG